MTNEKKRFFTNMTALLVSIARSGDVGDGFRPEGHAYSVSGLTLNEWEAILQAAVAADLVGRSGYHTVRILPKGEQFLSIVAKAL